MKVFMAVIILLYIGPVTDKTPDIKQIRSLFNASASNKEAAQQLLRLLSGVNKNTSALFICYYGAAEMMQANYGINPISKFSHFRKGKKLIEQAVAKDSMDIEIRFVRFAIQTNLPGFLNYGEHIQLDKIFLLNHLRGINDKELKSSIIKYLKASKYCSPEEKKQLAYE